MTYTEQDMIDFAVKSMEEDACAFAKWMRIQPNIYYAQDIDNEYYNLDTSEYMSTEQLYSSYKEKQ